ncbi:hypothetical protein LY90DRAFT_672023 [Neocallimastix californiae]|jgi:hypothetical protein|uniref:GH64 domain-containing protein n=1 Tax=Neocallimastix californiae TaxID=1754190 RepID=A0A1Y2C3K5_9FUNG|nr:hypothetical protein LY90DRAFT_672023 [Neocallimastix californiae]|eukprot:ORY41474.1 hypothetical protein LY90DRAFT_672023 [Neocallimastix californiae]
MKLLNLFTFVSAIGLTLAQCPNYLKSCGGACYSPNEYTCDNGTLCPVNMKSCNGACYSPKEYHCQNGGLVYGPETGNNSPPSNNNGTPTNPATPEGQKPQRDPSIPKKNGKMVIQIDNKTGGAWRDDEIYWVVLGRNQNHELSYLDLNGDLIRADMSLNDATTPRGNRRYASSIIHKLSDRKYVHLPAVESGRMYISYGEPVYITFNEGGYAGPDVNNPTDPNINTLFEYFEFTTESINGTITFHGNTTRVDFFSFPYMIRLMNTDGSYDRWEGDTGSRDEIFNSFKRSVSDPFKTLVDQYRIMAPCKTSFNEGRTYGDYFDDYINTFWSKYSHENLNFQCDAGSFEGHVEGNRMVFRKSGDNRTFFVDKPSTQDVLEGRGAFDRGSSSNPDLTRIELVIEAQLCAAFNRGIATEPSKWRDPSTYYKSNTVYNEYSQFFHNHSVTGKAYGFCYDDVNDQSTLLECGNADILIIDLKW